MKEYGYMEGNYLRSRFIEPQEYNYIDSDGIQRTKIISEDEQIAALSPEWKPVDDIDNSKVESAADGYIVVPVQQVRNEIKELKESLAKSDYQITKCYEASLIGEELPYDIVALRAKRQSERDKINELEALL